MSDHELRDVDRYELIAIVHGKSVAYKIWSDGAAATPGLEHRFLRFPVIHGANLALQLGFHVRTFFN